MKYTIYKNATGEILRIVICNDPEEQIADGEAYIEGEFSDIDYIVSNGQAVAKVSDAPEKTMCDDIGYLAYLRQVFELPPV